MFLNDDVMLILMITQGCLSDMTLDLITSGGKKDLQFCFPHYFLLLKNLRLRLTSSLRSLVFASRKPEASKLSHFHVQGKTKAKFYTGVEEDTSLRESVARLRTLHVFIEILTFPGVRNFLREPLVRRSPPS